MKNIFDTQQLEALSEQEHTAGRIKKDDRGNSYFEWSRENLTADTQEAKQLRMDALHHPDLALDEPKSVGMIIGDPYNSSPALDKPRRKKTDLRELSKLIVAQRTAKQGPSK